MNEMSHEEAFSEIAAVALDAVSPSVGDAIREHAGVCPECGPELTVLEEAVAAMGQLAPSAALNPGRSAGIRSRLVTRARAERETKSGIAAGPPDFTRGVASLTGLGHRKTPGAQRVLNGESKRVTPAPPGSAAQDTAPSSRRFNWLAIAATVALVATGAQLMRVSAERNTVRDRLVSIDTLTPRVDSLASALNQKEAMITAMTGPDVMVVPLASADAREQRGRVMWNRASNDWIMVTYGMPQPRQGMMYQVWLVTDDARIPAGMFRPDSDGKAMMQTTHALSRDALRGVAITEEPEGGVPAPTGPTVAAGSV